MQTISDHMIRRIRAKALVEARHLAGEFARAASRDREALLAALECERWLAQASADALDQ